MKDETRDQLERVRGGLSRTDYIEGAVLAQIARDLKDPDMPSLEDYRNAPSGIGPLAYEWEDKPHRLVYDLIKRLGWSPPEGEFPNSKEPKTIPAIREGELQDGNPIDSTAEALNRRYVEGAELIRKREITNPLYIRSSAESRAGVVPVPKKAQKGRK